MQKKIKNKRKKLVKIVNETKENIISQQLQADDKNIFSHFNVTNLKTFDHHLKQHPEYLIFQKYKKIDMYIN